MDLEADKAFLEVRVLRLHQALFHEAEETDNGRLGVLVGLAHPAQPVLVLVHLCCGRFQIVRQEYMQLVGVKNLARDLVDHDLIEAVHADAQSVAGGSPLPQLPTAAVVAVQAALARVLDEGRSAVPAASNAGQQCGTIDHARRNPFRVAALQKCLDGCKDLLVDDRGNQQLDPL
ncbi:MAG: hypothetical protein J0H65_06735 [Rhizobiales bacterium]|nr:hypothetical protein [Hyphomicrobiales bacterium]